MDTLSTYARRAGRFLVKRPLFSLVAILSLGIGIGATTAVFSVANRLLLRAPPGIAEPDRVVEIGRTLGGNGFDTFTYPDMLALREGAAPLEHVAGWRMGPMSVTFGGTGERVRGMNVSWNYFAALGLEPALGRWFRPEEDATPGTHAVAVVSHRFWQERLGGGSDVIGEEIIVNRHPFTVVGVLPAEFRSHIAGVRPDVYVPMMMATVTLPRMDLREALTSRVNAWFSVIARLRPGASLAQANAAVDAVFDRLRASWPEAYEVRSARVVEIGPIPGAGRGPATLFLAALLTLVGLVLLVACANVAGMLLARGATREKEIAVRLALGAGRGRVVRGMVGEALVLFAIGGVVGILIAYWATQVFAAVPLPAPVPIRLDFSPDARVLAFGLALTLVTGVLSSLLPALRASDLAPASSLKADAGLGIGGRRGRLRRAFVTAQVGLSFVLLVAAGLFLRSVQHAAQIPTGFDAPNARVMELDLSLDSYSPEDGQRFFELLTTRAEALTGVRSASLALDLPLDLSEHAAPVRPQGWPAGDGAGEWPLGADFNIVAPGYFETLGIRLLRGRDFTRADRSGSERVVIISRALTERAWPGEEPIGKTLVWSGEGGDDEVARTVVGIVEDVKNQGLTEELDGMVYVPFAQTDRLHAYLVVRPAGSGEALAAALREEVRRLDPSLPLTPVQPLTAYTGLATLPYRLGASVASVLGALALLLSGMGIYGVIAFLIARRTREIGVRVALGADRRAIRRLVRRRALRLALPGLAIGVPAAIGLAYLLRGLLLGIAPLDPVTFGAVAAVLLVAVLAASHLPGRRAASVDPMTALRAE